MRPEKPWIFLGIDSMVTSPKCQRYVPKMDLCFDASLHMEKLTVETLAWFQALEGTAGGGVQHSIK